MPNWCENTLQVTGPAKEIKRFKKMAQGRGPGAKKTEKVQPLSFHALVPQPKKYNTGEGWYNWRLSNWGTKWEASESRIIQDAKEILEYAFETAWGPPMEWLAKVGPKFPKLSLRLWYAEGGCYFAGVYVVENDSASNEEKDYIEAQLEEYGHYQVNCEHCDNELEITSKADIRICEDCLKHRCDNCGNQDTAHIDGKCPFDATMFKNISGERSNAESVGDAPAVQEVQEEKDEG